MFDLLLSEPLSPGISFQFSLLQLVPVAQVLPLCTASICSPHCLCLNLSVEWEQCWLFVHLSHLTKCVTNFPILEKEVNMLISLPFSTFIACYKVKTEAEETQKPYRFLYLYYRTFSKSVVWILHCWKPLHQLTFCFPLLYEWEFKTKFWMNSVKCCISMCENYTITRWV